MIDTLKELKSIEVIDTPEGVDRFLGELREAMQNETGQTSVVEDSSGRLCIAKQNPPVAMSDPYASPSRERIQEMVAERGMPWDEKYAERVIPWWASDERVDRQGDIVLQNWKFDDYQNNPLMLYAHRWDDPPIGTVIGWNVMERRSRSYNGRSLRLMPLFATKEQYEWADTIFRLAKARFLRTGSVGFYSDNIVQVRDPNERMRLGLGANGVIYDKNNLIEWTVAPVPANQGALQSLSLVARKGLLRGDDLRVVTDIFKSSVPRGRDDSRKMAEIESALVKHWNNLFPATKTVSTVDTPSSEQKALPESYQEATGSRKCENCAAYKASEDDVGSGYCQKYNSVCRANMVCNSWSAARPTEITKEGQTVSGDAPVAVPQRWDDAMQYIEDKVAEHQAEYGKDPRKQTSVGVLQQVFARGVDAWDNATPEERNGADPESWGYGRLMSYLSALENLRYQNGAHDTDLLPEKHPLSSGAEAAKTIIARINRSANKFLKGDFVTWNSRAGLKIGRIDRVEVRGLAVSNDEEMEATPEDPVAVVSVVSDDENGKKSITGRRLMPFSRLKGAPSPFPEPSSWYATDEQKERVGEFVMDHNKEVANDPKRVASLGSAVHVYERGLGSYVENRQRYAGTASAEQYAEARLAHYLSALRGHQGGMSGDEDLFPSAIEGSRRQETLMAISAKSMSYSDMDFTPPSGAVEEARRGLEWRREYNRGGTEIGVARARDIVNGKNLSPNTVRRMHSYFSRHEVDKQGEGFSPDESGYPSAGRIAWALWGGDAAQDWSRKMIRQMNSRDSKMYEPIGVIGGLRGRMNEATDRYREIYRWVRVAEAKAIAQAVKSIGVRTDINYEMLGEDDAMAKFIASVLLAAEIGGNPTDPDETLKFVRNCVATAIRRQAMAKITQATAKRNSEITELSSVLREFDEDKIARDENGRCASTGGSGSDSSSSDAEVV